MNVWNGIGNLASEVESRKVDVAGKDVPQTVASFLLAVDRPGVVSGTDFIRVIVWNGVALACAKYLRKGSRIAVEGRLRSSKWEKDGETKYGLDIAGRRVTFVSGGTTRDTTYSADESKAPF